MDAAPLVRLAAATKRFGPVAAVDGVDLEIRPGEVTAVVGPDGAGKTTLLRLMAGLLLPEAGTVTVAGHDTALAPEAARASLGYMPQRFGLYEDLSVAENLALHADLQDLPAGERGAVFERLLGFTGLAPFTDRLAGALSGGMKQKLGLACVLLRAPRLLLLDEPTVGVDPLSRRELWAMVRDLIDPETAVVWSTGYLDEAERCGRVVVLDGGRVRHAGPPGALAATLAGRTFRIHGAVGQRRRLQRMAGGLPGVLDAQVEGPAVRLVMAPGVPPPEPAALGVPEARIAAVEPRLEDAFVALLAGGGPVATAARPRLPAGPEQASAIEVRGLTRRFGAFVATDHVSFSVRRGEVFGLLGPNGAGKSTTFRMLCGLLPPSEGQALVAGYDLGTAAPAARGRLGYVAQKFSLYGTLTGRQNIAFFGGVYGLGRRALAEAGARVVAGLHLGDALDQTVADLPLGLKQRLAVACAVLHEPEILFLDEPTSGVDPLTRREFWRHINGFAEAGVTVMVTTHFLEEAEYCDRVALMAEGRVIALGAPEDLKAAHRSAALPEPTLEDAFIALVAEAASAAAGGGAP